MKHRWRISSRGAQRRQSRLHDLDLLIGSAICACIALSLEIRRKRTIMSPNMINQKIHDPSRVLPSLHTHGRQLNPLPHPTIRRRSTHIDQMRDQPRIVITSYTLHQSYQEWQRREHEVDRPLVRDLTVVPGFVVLEADGVGAADEPDVTDGED